MNKEEREAAKRRAEEALERAEKASVGPWTPNGMGIHSPIPGRPGWTQAVGFIEEEEDHVFVIHARTDVPELAQDNLTLSKRLEQVEAENRRLHLAEVSRLGQEIEEPSYDELYAENTRLKEELAGAREALRGVQSLATHSLEEANDMGLVLEAILAIARAALQAQKETK